MTWLLPSALSHCAPASECSTKDFAPGSSTSRSDLTFWLTLSGKPMQRPGSWPGWKKRVWSRRLFGAATLPHRSSTDWLATWLASRPASHVSLSRSRDRAKAKKTSVGYGPTSLDSFASFDRPSSSWRTFQALFPAGTSPLFSGTWPPWGSMRSGYVSPREKPALLTNGSGSSSWPSTRSEDAESCGNHPGKTDSLSGAVSAWPTPHGFQAGNGPAGNEFSTMVRGWQTPATDSFRSRGGSRKDEMGLDQEARHWATPRSGEAKGGAYQRDHGRPGAERDTLTGEASKWATPLSRDYAGVNPPETLARKRAKGHGVSQLNDQAATWPTPTEMMTGDRTDPETFKARAARMKVRHGSNTGNGAGTDLGMAAKTWPTPNTMPDAPNGGLNRGGGAIRARETPQGLGKLATSWPTPAARDHKGENSEEHLEVGTGRKHLDQLPNFVKFSFSPPAQATAAGQASSPNTPTSRPRLNPAFVCWLMGWPWFWTRAEPISCGSAEMESFRRKQRALLSSLLGD